MSSRKLLYETIYHHVKQESELSWHSEGIPLLLKKVIKQLNGSGKVLDIGCGTGVYSTFMAQQGLQVTGLDFVATALQFAGNRAKEFGLNIQFVQADVTKWDTPEKYDLILDSGCLHGINGKNRIQYKEHILKWLSADSSYVLVHFGKCWFFDLSLHSLVGLKPRTKSEIQAFFGPELQLVEFNGGTGKESLFQYWFNFGQ